MLNPLMSMTDGELVNFDSDLVSVSDVDDLDTSNGPVGVCRDGEQASFNGPSGVCRDGQQGSFDGPGGIPGVGEQGSFDGPVGMPGVGEQGSLDGPVGISGFGEVASSHGPVCVSGVGEQGSFNGPDRVSRDTEPVQLYPVGASRVAKQFTFYPVGMTWLAGSVSVDGPVFAPGPEVAKNDPIYIELNNMEAGPVDAFEPEMFAAIRGDRSSQMYSGSISATQPINFSLEDEIKCNSCVTSSETSNLEESNMFTLISSTMSVLPSEPSNLLEPVMFTPIPTTMPVLPSEPSTLVEPVTIPFHPSDDATLNVDNALSKGDLPNKKRPIRELIKERIKKKRRN